MLMIYIVLKTHKQEISNNNTTNHNILSNKTDPTLYGEWEPIKYRFRYLPVHMALLHTGKVLAFGGSGTTILP